MELLQALQADPATLGRSYAKVSLVMDPDTLTPWVEEGGEKTCVAFRCNVRANPSKRFIAVLHKDLAELLQARAAEKDSQWRLRGTDLGFDYDELHAPQENPFRHDADDEGKLLCDFVGPILGKTQQDVPVIRAYACAVHFGDLGAVGRMLRERQPISYFHYLDPAIRHVDRWLERTSMDKEGWELATARWEFTTPSKVSRPRLKSPGVDPPIYPRKWIPFRFSAGDDFVPSLVTLCDANLRAERLRQSLWSDDKPIEDFITNACYGTFTLAPGQKGPVQGRKGMSLWDDRQGAVFWSPDNVDDTAEVGFRFDSPIEIGAAACVIPCDVLADSGFCEVDVSRDGDAWEPLFQVTPASRVAHDTVHIVPDRCCGGRSLWLRGRLRNGKNSEEQPANPSRFGYCYNERLSLDRVRIMREGGGASGSQIRVISVPLKGRDNSGLPPCPLTIGIQERDPSPEHLAAILSRKQGRVLLPGVRTMDPLTADIIGGAGGHVVICPTRLDAAMAASLVKKPGTVELVGFRSLDKEVAAALAGGRKKTMLPDLREASVDSETVGELLRAIVETPGKLTIHFRSDATLASEHAEIVAKGLKDVVFDGLTALNGDGLRALSRPLSEDAASAAPGQDSGASGKQEDKQGLRMEFPSLVRVRIESDVASSLVTAIVRGSGVVSLASGVRLTRELGAALATGNKTMILEGDGEPDAGFLEEVIKSTSALRFTALCRLSPECGAALAAYSGEVIHMDSVQQVDGDALNRVAPLLKSGKLRLPAAGVYEVSVVDDIAKKLGASEDAETRQVAGQWLELDKNRDWSGRQGAKLTGRVTRVTPQAIVIKAVARGEVLVFRDQLANGSARAIDRLDECAGKVLRKDSAKAVIE